MILTTSFRYWFFLAVFIISNFLARSATSTPQHSEIDRHQQEDLNSLPPRSDSSHLSASTHSSLAHQVRRCDQSSPIFEDSSPPSASITPRSLTAELTASGLRFIFSQFDIIVSSTLAYRYTTEFYRNLTTVLLIERRPSPAPLKLVFAYGALKLTAGYMHGQGLTEDTLARILLGFAEYMLDLLALVVFGAFQLAVWMKGVVRVWIRMEIQGNPPGLGA